MKSQSTRAEQVAQTLYKRIQAGEWQVGAKLPPAAVLAQQLDVGSSSLREAIQHLTARGLLQPRRGSGVFLVSLEDGLERRLSDHFSDSRSALEVRLALEVEAAELAARRRTDEDIRELLSRLKELETARQEDNDRFVAAEIAFHRAAVIAAHNPVLLWLFDEFAPIMAQTISISRREFGIRYYDPAKDPHALMVQQIIEQDTAAASRSLRTHLEALISEQAR